jgi:hypothetical protein
MLQDERQRDEGNPNPPEQYPNFRERNPSLVEQIPNPAERNPNSNPSLSYAFSMTYATKSRFRLQTPRHRRPCVLPGLFVGPSVFVSGSSDLFKQVKGWRRFTIADGVFVRRVVAISVRPVGRGA